MLESQDELTVDQSNYKNIEKLCRIRHTSRVNLVRKITIVDDSYSGIIRNLFEQILADVKDGNSNLRSLDVSAKINLSTLDPELISQAIVNLEEFRIRDYRVRPLTPLHLESIFGAMEQRMELRILHLPSKYSGHVPSDPLMTSLMKLKDTNIFEYLKFPRRQAISLFNKMAENPIMKLKRINLERMDCSCVSADQFAAVLVRMEAVKLKRGINPGQVWFLFEKIASSEDMKLRELNLSQVSVSHIPPDILSQGLAKLEELDASNSKLTPGQVSAVFQQLANSEHHNLRTLTLDHNDLSAVPSQILASAISGLEEAGLVETCLTTNQLTGIFSLVAERKCPRMRRILLSGNHSLIPKELYDQAMMCQSSLSNGPIIKIDFSP